MEVFNRFKGKRDALVCVRVCKFRCSRWTWSAVKWTRILQANLQAILPAILQAILRLESAPRLLITGSDRSISKEPAILGDQRRRCITMSANTQLLEESVYLPNWRILMFEQGLFNNRNFFYWVQWETPIGGLLLEGSCWRAPINGQLKGAQCTPEIWRLFWVSYFHFFEPFERRLIWRNLFTLWRLTEFTTSAQSGI